MTREKAIKSVKETTIKLVKEVAGMSLDWDDAHYDALQMAIKALEQEPILDKIRAEVIKYEGECRLSVDEYPSCKQCNDNVFETIYGILDKYKTESEDKE